MNRTHPVKELIFVIKETKNRDTNYTQSRCGKQWYNYSTEFDYTGFTGTPEPHTGNGMCGHRTNQNLWNGMPSISLPYIENEFTPDLGETAANNSSTKWLAGQTYTTSVATSNSNKTKMGYDGELGLSYRYRFRNTQVTTVPETLIDFSVLHPQFSTILTQ